MTFYYPTVFYDKEARWDIFPLLKSLLKLEEKCHGELKITDQFDKADCVIIPMSWNYYHKKKLVDKLMTYYHGVAEGILVISFVFGDIGVLVPKEFNGYVFRTSGRKTKLGPNHKGMPVFIEDPILEHYNEDLDVINKVISVKPKVGFCGQAVKFGIQSLKELVKTTLKNVLSICGLSKKNTEALISTTYFRWKILKKIQQSDKVTSNFILRRHYRAGIKQNKDKHPTTLEFYENIKNSDYIVCMRGAGNFSKRFYETLAMGRIPVFINTNCLLPLDNKIDWKQHVVWIEYGERHLIAKKVYEFHKKHTKTSLNDLFLANRNLWQNQLQLYSFFNSFFNENQ